MRNGRDEVLALRGKLHAALRHMVNRNKTNRKHSKHQKTDEHDKFTAGSALRGVHLERDLRKRSLQRFRKQFRRDVVAFTESDKRLVLVDKRKDKRILLIALGNALVLFNFVLYQVREIGTGIDNKALDEHIRAASDRTMENNVVRVNDRLEEIDFRFHRVRRFRIDQADQKTRRVKLCRFDAKGKVARLGNLFDTRLIHLLLFARTCNIEILFVNLVDEPAIVLASRISLFLGTARSRYDSGRRNSRKARRIEDQANLVANGKALVPIHHRDSFKDAIRENRRTQVSGGVQLEMPDEPNVMAPLRKFRKLGHCDLFTAKYRNRPDESVVGIRTPVFDGEVSRDVLVQILEHRERVFLVAKERRRLQLCIGMA